MSGSWNGVNLDNISEERIRTLKDIIAFCDKRGISLTLVSAPMSNYMIAGKENYDEYIKFVRSTIAGTGVDYYDFNLCKEQFFPNTSSFFSDKGHLNLYGAETFSSIFADFINGEIQEDELFYSSYKEKLENLEPTVFGIDYNDSENDNGETIRNCRIVSTGNDELEYEINALPEDGRSYKIQNFSSDRFFDISPEEHGTLTIAYRLNNARDKVWTVNISY